METFICPFCGKEKSVMDPSSSLALRCPHCGKFFKNPAFSSLNQRAEYLKKRKEEVKRKKVVASSTESNFISGVCWVFGIILGLVGLFYFGMKNELLGFLVFVVTLALVLPVNMLIEYSISDSEDDDMEGLSYQEMVNVKKKEIEKEMFWRDVREFLGFLFLGLWKILKFAVILFFSILTVGAFIVAGKKE